MLLSSISLGLVVFCLEKDRPQSHPHITLLGHNSYCPGSRLDSGGLAL